MALEKRYTLTKFISTSVWLLAAAGLIVLLVAAISKKNTQIIKHIEISILGIQNHYFINKKDVKEILERVHKKPLDKPLASSLNLVLMEKELQKEKWIKNAELFFDNNNVLQVIITEREPVARIFTTSGASFYIDSSLAKLPLSKKFSPRLPVFTSFPTDVIVLTREDSLLLADIRLMGQFIEENDFWMAQIEQVDITPNRTFELVPKMGNQIIRFGNMDNYREKFNNLLAFYKRVQVKTGWNKYSILDVQFKDQVVAVKRDAKEIKADSLRAIQIMKNIIEEAKRRTNDSTTIQLNDQPEKEHININRSRVREEVPEQNDVEEYIPPAEEQPDRITTSVEPKAVQTEKLPANTSPILPLKKPELIQLKKEDQKKEEPKKPEPAKKKGKQQVKETPKAIMPPKAVMPPQPDSGKSDYE